MNLRELVGQLLVKPLKFKQTDGPQGLVQAPHSVSINVGDEDILQHLLHDSLLATVPKTVLFVRHDAPEETHKHTGTLMIQRNPAKPPKHEDVRPPLFFSPVHQSLQPGRFLSHSSIDCLLSVHIHVGSQTTQNVSFYHFFPYKHTPPKVNTDRPKAESEAPWHIKGFILSGSQRMMGKTGEGVPHPNLFLISRHLKKGTPTPNFIVYFRVTYLSLVYK